MSMCFSTSYHRVRKAIVTPPSTCKTAGRLIINLTNLSRAATASGIHLVAAAGSYTEAYLNESLTSLDVDSLTTRFINEVNTGLDGTSIRAGLIGEMGCS